MQKCLIFLCFLPFVLCFPHSKQYDQLDSKLGPNSCVGVDSVCGNVLVGTPEINMPVVFGTGSKYSWFFSNSYKTKLNEPVYNPDKSSTASDALGEFSCNTGIYYTMGYKYTDQFLLDSNNFTQLFGGSYTLWSNKVVDPSGLHFSGIVGLAWDPKAIANNKEDPNAAVTNIVGSDGNFTVYRDFGAFHWAVDSNASRVSQDLITWNGFDSEHCQNDLIYFNLVPELSVAYPLTFYTDSWRYDRVIKVGPYSSVLDTALEQVYVSLQMLGELARQIPFDFDVKGGFNTIDCDGAYTLNPVQFTINMKQFNLDPYFYIVDVGFTDNQCVFAVTYDQDINDQIDVAFGAPMLRQYCSVYDLKRNQIGLATAIHKN